MSKEKKIIPDPKSVPFEAVLLKCVDISGKKVVIIVPEQGLETGFVKYDDISSLDTDKYFSASVFQNADGEKGYFTKEVLKAHKLPTPKDIEESKGRVALSFKKMKELEDEAKKMKANAFKEDNEIPPVPKDLFISDKVWDLAAASLKLDKYTILLGPKGCGKTETAKQLAIACNHKYVSFNMGAAFKPKQMFAGMLQAENGNTIFVESEFLRAFQATEPTLIFLDEITRTPQVATNYLMTILDRNQSYIYIEELGKRVYKGEGVRFISAGNVGSQYTDTRTLDGAFWDRFIKLPIDYLPKVEEEKLVCARAPKANKTHVKILIERANKCREAEKSGSITSGISTRQLIDMANYLEIGFSIDDVFENIFLNNFINGNTNEVTEVRAVCQS
jgi:nitric oxide reductase NorQ protein